MGELISKYVSNKAWARYKKIVRNFMDIDAGRQPIIWLRHINQMLAFAEDSTPQFTAIPMEALCFYNAFRNWPIDKSTSSGALDEENLSIYVSTQAIEKLGFLNQDKYWDFNWTEDRFVIHGMVYMPSGDTEISQAKDESLAFMVILKRDQDTIINGNIYNQLADINGVPYADINSEILIGKP